MGKRDPRVDAYIAKSADFAKPILLRLRETVHQACPPVEEAMKWSFPHFLYHGMLCSMASFKQHCAFGFWKGTLVVDPADHPGEPAMGDLGRITKLSELPSRRVLAGYVKKAMKLNVEGIKPARTRSKPKPAPVVPAELKRALSGNKRAQATFQDFRPSHQREYVEWISEAKTEATRRRRLDTAVEWMAEGKARNWKYDLKQQG